MLSLHINSQVRRSQGNKLVFLQRSLPKVSTPHM